MQTGDKAPRWALDLIDKWVEFDERHYGLGKIKIFVLYCDDLDGKIRIWGIDEHKARNEANTPGVFVSYIEKDKYNLIFTPTGLEQYTDTILNKQK